MEYDDMFADEMEESREDMPHDDYDDSLRIDEMACANGDYNAFEEEQIFQEGGE